MKPLREMPKSKKSPCIFHQFGVVWTALIGSGICPDFFVVEGVLG